MYARLASLDARRAALLVAAIAAATLAGAWAFEKAGHLPCELCLLQRKPYYAAILVGLAAGFAPPRAARWGLALLALIFVASAGFGLYHAGVEWGAWPGPTACTGSAPAGGSAQDLLKQLETVQIVRCDQVALRILGLSLAGWNAIVSSGLAAFAAAGARRG